MMFSMTQVPQDWKSPYRFENQCEVPGDPDTVFDALIDAEVEAEWFPDYRGVTWETPEPHGVGTVREYRLSYMRIIEHFTVWARGERLVFCLSGGTLPLISSFMEDYRLEPARDGRTRVKWTVQFTPRGWTWPIRPLLIWFFAKDFKKAMDQFEGLMSR